CCALLFSVVDLCFFFQAEDGIRDRTVTGVQTCALPIFRNRTVYAPESEPPEASAGAAASAGAGAPEAAGADAAVVEAAVAAPPEIGRASCRERGEVLGAGGAWGKRGEGGGGRTGGGREP